MRTSLRPLIAVGALGLALALGGCGDDGSSASAPTESPSATPQSPEASTVGPTLDVEISGDDVQPSGEQVDATSGDVLLVTVTSDRPGELHVHTSPEQELEFDQGTTELKVELEQPGQVDIEEHESDSLIARVLVK
jgi:hypothetical protein